MRGRSSLGVARVVSVSGAATVVSALPVFLAGALAVELTRDLAFGPAGLGALVALQRGTSALTAMPMGRLVDRVGPGHALRLAAGLAAVAFLGIATTATSWEVLAAWMMFAGSALVLSEPAANAMLMSSVPGRHLGLALGIKQAALPAASMLAGLSVPVIALTIGWRWVYIFCVPLAVAVLLAVPRELVPRRQRPVAARATSRLGNHGTLVILGSAFGMGTAAALIIPAFYVAAAVDAGSSGAVAGIVLALCSVGAIGGRVLSGLVSDRYVNDHLRLCALMIFAGAVGLAMLASGEPWFMAVGAVGAAIGVWGNQGVFWFALLKKFDQSPGRITGSLAPAGLLGGTLGPLLFGLIATWKGFSAAWLFTTGMALVAGAVMLAARGRLASIVPDDERGG